MDFLKYTILDMYLPFINDDIILKNQRSENIKNILAEIIEKTVILMSPIIPYNSEDIY